MIAPANVKASVVDITKPRTPFPRLMSVDANVLYFVYYPNFAQLQLAGGKVPYQTKTYPAWLNKALQAGTKFLAAPATMGEFVRSVEYAELESVWLTDPNTPPGSRFSPVESKKARYTYWSQMSVIRQNANTILAAARKKVDLLPKFKSEADELDQAASEWCGAAGDFSDALLVATSKMVRVLDVVSDDIDLLTFGGITVHTANRNAIQAAAAAGKLIT